MSEFFNKKVKNSSHNPPNFRSDIWVIKSVDFTAFLNAIPLFQIQRYWGYLVLGYLNSI